MHSQSISSSSIADEKIHISLQDAFMSYPKLNYVYHLKSYSNHDTVITFSGDGLEAVSFFDLSSLSFIKISADLHSCSLKLPDDWCFVSSQSVPFKEASQFLYASRQDKLYIIDKLDIRLNLNNTYSLNFSTSLYSEPYSFDNICILKEFQAFFPKIRVGASLYPLFLKPQRPSPSSLDSLYKNFLSFNNKSKLNYQYSQSSQKCHIRAHFVSLLLEKAYGIQSFKLFKFWDPKSWELFDNKKWSFHCATLIIDQNNYPWVWDPWVVYSPQLLRLNQWLYRSDEPTPTSIAITNSIVIGPNINTPDPYFMETHPRRDITEFQAVLLNAVPNPPQFSLGSLSFFTQKKEESRKKNEPKRELFNRGAKIELILINTLRLSSKE